MSQSKKILITGGAGFIGSNLIRYLINNSNHSVVNIDKLTYAGNLHSLKDLEDNPQYYFEHVDICDRKEIQRIFNEHKPSAIMHLAAESHVDRSIDGPADFIHTNILGTFALLDTTRDYWKELPENEKKEFRFLHVSTDEVFGSLEEKGFFTEATPYQPSSPYSASKASSDHLARAWFHTYSLPVLITNCSNNYGPYQFPEKLIPVVILKALKGDQIPVYGKGKNVRDWLFVQDHVIALLSVLENGETGETYNIGTRNEQTNIDLVRNICHILNELVANPVVPNHADLITFVKDRPGHDLRYAIDPQKIEKELGWKSGISFEQGLRTTVQWYLDNQDWCNQILDGSYRLERIGLDGK